MIIYTLPLIWSGPAVKERIDTLINLIRLYLFPICDHIVIDSFE